MKETFRNIPFRHKIILVCCAVLTANALFTGAASYVFTRRNTAARYERQSYDMAQQMELYLGDKINDMTQRINALSNNLAFVEPMRVFLLDDGMVRDPILAGDIARMLAEMEAGDRFIHSIYIVTPKGLFDEYLLIRDRSVGFEDTDMYRYMQDNPDQTAVWFPAMKSPLYETDEIVIPAVYRKTIAGRELFFVVQLSQKALAEYLDQIDSSPKAVFVADRQGQTVLPAELPMETVLHEFTGTEESSRRVTLNGQHYFAARAVVAASGWQVYLLSPEAVMLGNLQSLRTFLIAETLVLLFICTLVILWFANRLTATMEGLSRTMAAAARENYQTEFHTSYRDEIGQLAQSYNEMLTQIRCHIHALEDEKQLVQEIQQQKRKAEFAALQAQINPHFLYNTLNMITWQAVDLGAEDISVISSALGKYFRISLSKGQEIIPLRDEMAHVKSYLEIQKIRYKSKLRYCIELPKELEEVPVVKLILQPLAENALYHGIKVKQGGGSLRITAARNGGSLLLLVEDDGAGAEPERLEHLNAQLASGTGEHTEGYGIFNVNDRLHLYYGEAAGLRMFQREGGGVRSVITIPIGSGDAYDSDRDRGG